MYSKKDHTVSMSSCHSSVILWSLLLVSSLWCCVARPSKNSDKNEKLSCSSFAPVWSRQQPSVRYICCVL